MTGSTTSTGAPSFSAVTLDTTAGSALHILPRVLDRLGFGAFAPVALYASAVALTFLPLVIVGWFGPLSMTIRSSTLKMPFFYDASTIFLFVVSFPCLLILTVTDQKLLSSSLSRVQLDGIVAISEANGTALAKRWYRLFRMTNLAAQAFGLAVGGIAIYFLFRGATTTIGSWTALDKHMLPVGYIFLYCNFLFSAVTTVYVVRSIAVAVLLRDIVAHAELHILPLHPDKAGGLQPIGRLGLRNQYALTLLGLNIVLGGFVAYHFLNQDNDVIRFVAAAAIAYVTIGPLVFVAPLLPFRDGMMRNKAQLMNGVALRMRGELDDLRSRFQSGAITAEDAQLLERLCKIGAVIEDLPVWPFDAFTLRKFFTAYVVPIIGSLSVPAGKALLGYFKITIPFLQ
jgi:hypothetical protein